MLMAPKRKRKCLNCKEMFLPQHDQPSAKQRVCCNACCIEYYDHKLKVRKTKRVARTWASQVGKRSMGEVRFEHKYLEKRKTISFEYESDRFEYEVRETKHYTPDFTVRTKSGKTIYIEYKGVLDLDTRKKMLLVKEQYPKLDIRFVFQRGTNKIRKGSKTTYMMWAAQKGFKAADGEIPKSWLR